MRPVKLTLMYERVKVQVLPAFERLSTFRARERVACVKQSVQTHRVMMKLPFILGQESYMSNKAMILATDYTDH